MPSCNVQIEVDGDQPFVAGSEVHGRVIIHADEDVRSKGVWIRPLWRTHGRGNTSSETFESQKLHEGPIQAGQRLSCPFTIRIADWPPSYSGTHIQIQHYVDAWVDVPWKFDPKDRQSVQVVASESPVEAPSEMGGRGKAIGCTIGALVLGFFTFIGFQIIGVYALLALAVISSILFAGWLIFSHLPRRRLGHVEIEWPRAAVGTISHGTLRITPKRSVTTGPITLQIEGAESAVSGSGTNRTTHTHRIHLHEQTVRDSLLLKSGLTETIPLPIEIAANLPPSISLSSNSIHWKARLRVSLPGWPDFRHAQSFVVVPPRIGEPSDRPRVEGASPVSAAATPEGSASPAAVSPQSSNGSPEPFSFGEIAKHVYGVREDEATRDRVVEAVQGMRMPIFFCVDRRLLYTGDDPHVRPDDYAVWANASDPPLPLVLYVAHDLGDDLEQFGDEVLVADGEILDWDDRHRRLRIRLDGRPERA